MRKTVIFAEPFLSEIRIQRLDPEKIYWIPPWIYSAFFT